MIAHAQCMVMSGVLLGLQCRPTSSAVSDLSKPLCVGDAPVLIGYVHTVCVMQSLSTVYSCQQKYAKSKPRSRLNASTSST